MESTTQIFLRVQRTEDENDVVEGESLVGEYAKRVQIGGFTFGVDVQLQALTKSPKQASSKPVLRTLHVSKVFDRASLQLAALMRGSERPGGKVHKPIPLHEIRITVDQQLEEHAGEVKGKAQNAIIVFHLMQAQLMDIKLDATEDKVSTSIKESLTFMFNNFEIEYYYKGMENNIRSDYRDKYVGFVSDHPELHVEG